MSMKTPFPSSGPPSCPVEKPEEDRDDDVIFVGSRPCTHRAVKSQTQTSDMTKPQEQNSISGGPVTPVAQSSSSTGNPVLNEVKDLKDAKEGSQNVSHKAEDPVKAMADNHLSTSRPDTPRARSEPSIGRVSPKSVKLQSTFLFGRQFLEPGQAKAEKAKQNLAAKQSSDQHVIGQSIDAPDSREGIPTRRSSFHATPIRNRDWVYPEWWRDIHIAKTSQRTNPSKPPVLTKGSLSVSETVPSTPQNIVPLKRGQELISNTQQENRLKKAQVPIPAKRCKRAPETDQVQETPALEGNNQLSIQNQQNEQQSNKAQENATVPASVSGRNEIADPPRTTSIHQAITKQMMASFPIPSAVEVMASNNTPVATDTSPSRRNETLWSIPAFDKSVDPKHNPGYRPPGLSRAVGYQDAATSSQNGSPMTNQIPHTAGYEHKSAHVEAAPSIAVHAPRTQPVPASSALAPSSGTSTGTCESKENDAKEKKYIWTQKMYLEFSQILYRNFGFREFAAKYGLPLKEVIDKFSAVVQLPLFDYSDKAQEDTVNLCRKRVASFKRREKELLHIHLAEEQMRKKAEDERVKAANAKTGPGVAPSYGMNMKDASMSSNNSNAAVIASHGSGNPIYFQAAKTSASTSAKEVASQANKVESDKAFHDGH